MAEELQKHAGKVSIHFPYMTNDVSEFIGFGEFVRDTSATRLWTGQSLQLDSGQLFGTLVGAGIRIPTGFGVSLMPFRHPYETALQARSLARMTGQPCVVGLGVATRDLVAGLHGAPYSDPLRAAGEYLRIVRGLLDGEKLAFRGEFHHMHGHLLPSPISEVEVGLGVLRRGSAATAGRYADVAVTLLTPADYLREEIVPTMAEAADGRARRPRVVTIAHVMVDTDGRDPRRTGGVAVMGHLGKPHYRQMLQSAGVSLDTDDIAVVMERLIEARAFLFGTAEEIADDIKKLWLSGVDEVVLNSCAVLYSEGPKAALEDARSVIGTLEGTI